MNKLTTLIVIATAALVFGMITPDLAANATGSSKNDNTGKNYDNHNDDDDQDDQDDHDDDCRDDDDDCRDDDDDCRDDDDDDDNRGSYRGSYHNDCHDDDHDDDDNDGSVIIVPPTVKVYKVVINHQGTIPSMASFGVELNNTQVITNGTSFTIAPDTPATLTELGLIGYEFVEIRGDGHCPENLGGTITLDNDQHIECYIVNQPAGSSGPIEPGVIFHYNTLVFNSANPAFGDGCSAAGKTAPCVELANIDEDNSVLIVDEELKTDTTIVLFSLVEADKVNQTPPQFAVSPLCVLSGMGPHTDSYARGSTPVDNPTGKMGFEIQCSLIEADTFKVSYALIETNRGS